MVWCSYCAKDQVTERDDTGGFTCCTGCGRVLADDALFNETTLFSRAADGSSQAEGNFVYYTKQTRIVPPRIACSQGRVLLGFQSESHEKTLNKSKHEIEEIAERLLIQPRTAMIEAAHRFYTIAVERRSFTRGRRVPQVAAACLYIVCRQENKPYMLIDFSDSIQTNVYVLGAVFLQLCQLLRLEHHAMMARPIDPSLFIHRFADRLRFDSKMHAVANSALRLVASMKRDWMQTGRRPSGVCGAALFIAAHIHGFERSKSEITSVVHIGEATLRRRLVEFQQTDSSNLTAEEFNSKAMEIESSSSCTQMMIQGIIADAANSILCEHKEAIHHAHGLCRACYDEFVKVSGGMSQGGSHPPAFKEAQKKENITPLIHVVAIPSANDDGIQNDDDEHEGTLSDIDDEEVEGYLHNEEEVRLKTIIWTEMNKEYLEIQEAKRAAAIESKVDVVAKVKKKVIKRKRVEEALAESAAEAARGMLASKKLSSKWNYGVLETLFDQENAQDVNITKGVYDQGFNGFQDVNLNNNTKVEAKKVEEDIDDEEVDDDENLNNNTKVEAKKDDDEEFDEGHSNMIDEEEYYDEY